MTRVNLDGWMLSPGGKWCYRFHCEPIARTSDSFVFVDKWVAMPDGSPSAMEERCKLPLNDALELCGNLLLDGWKKLEINCLPKTVSSNKDE